MAGEKTQVQIDAQIDAGIRVNGNKEITPPIHNAIEKAITNSYLNKKDGGMVVEVLAGYTTELTPSDNKHWTPKRYVDDKISDNAYDATSWNGVTAIAPSKNAVRDKIEALISDFIKTAGTSTLAVNAEVNLDGFDFDFIDGADTLIHLEPDKICFFTDTPFADTSFSLKSKSVGSGTFASIWQDVNGTEVYKFRDDGYLFCNSIGDLGAGYGLNFASATLRQAGGGLVLDIGSRTLTKNGDVPTLYFGDERTLAGDWLIRNVGLTETIASFDTVNLNIGFNGTSYGSGSGVIAIGNATTDTSTNPTNGTIIKSKDVAASSELFVLNEAGFETQLS